MCVLWCGADVPLVGLVVHFSCTLYTQVPWQERREKVTVKTPKNCVNMRQSSDAWKRHWQMKIVCMTNSVLLEKLKEREHLEELYADVTLLQCI